MFCRVNEVVPAPDEWPGDDDQYDQYVRESGRVSSSDYPHRWTPEGGVCRYCGQVEAVCPGIAKPVRVLDAWREQIEWQTSQPPITPASSPS